MSRYIMMQNFNEPKPGPGIGQPHIATLPSSPKFKHKKQKIEEININEKITRSTLDRNSRFEIPALVYDMNLLTTKEVRLVPIPVCSVRYTVALLRHFSSLKRSRAWSKHTFSDIWVEISEVLIQSDYRIHYDMLPTVFYTPFADIINKSVLGDSVVKCLQVIGAMRLIELIQRENVMIYPQSDAAFAVIVKHHHTIKRFWIYCCDSFARILTRGVKVKKAITRIVKFESQEEFEEMTTLLHIRRQKQAMCKAIMWRPRNNLKPILEEERLNPLVLDLDEMEDFDFSLDENLRMSPLSRPKQAMSLESYFAKDKVIADAQGFRIDCAKLAFKTFVSEKTEYIDYAIEAKQILSKHLYSFGTYIVAIYSASTIKQALVATTQLWGHLMDTERSAMKVAYDRVYNFIKSCHMPSAQSSPFVEGVKSVRDGIKWLGQLDLVKKFVTLVASLMTTTIGMSLGLNKVPMTSPFRQKIKKLSRSSPLDILVLLFDCLVDFTDGAYQYFVEGNKYAFVHSGDSYGQWVTDVQQLLSKYDVRVDDFAPEKDDPNYITLSEFDHKMHELIRQGEEILVASGHIMPIGVRNMVNSNLQSLRATKNKIILSEKMVKQRTAPFSMLVYGPPRIAKSQMLDLLIRASHESIFEGKVPYNTRHKYIRNSLQDYWDGFHSEVKYVILDDIGSIRTDIQNGIPPEMKELIMINNDVSYSLNMAHLDDKGKTPFDPLMTLATGNFKHFFAHKVFNNLAAALRRLEFVLTLEVLEEFKKGTEMCKQKIPDDGDLMNIWHIKLERVVVGESSEDGRSTVRYETVLETDEISDLLRVVGSLVRDHMKQAAKAKRAGEALKKITFCKEHNTILCDRCETETVDLNMGVDGPMDHPMCDGGQCKICLDNYPDYKWESDCTDTDSSVDEEVLFDKCDISLLPQAQMLDTYVISTFAGIFLGRFAFDMWRYIRTKHDVVRGMYKNAKNMFNDKDKMFKNALTAIGDMRAQQIASRRTVKLVKALGAALTAGGAVMLTKFAMDKILSTEGEAQGNTFCPQKEDPYVKHVVCHRDMYTPLMKSATYSQILNKLRGNVFSAILTFPDGKVQPLTLFAIRGTEYITTNHLLPVFTTATLKLFAVKESALSETKVYTITHKDIARNEDLDVVMINLVGAVPRYNVTKFLLDKTPDLDTIKSYRYNAHLVTTDGNQLCAIEFTKPYRYRKKDGTLLKVKSDHMIKYVPNKFGWCGSPLIVNIEQGACIMGMHIMGSDLHNFGASTPLSLCTVNELSTTLNPSIPSHIAAGVFDTTNHAGSSFELTDEVHVKNPVAFCQGVGIVIGSVRNYPLSSPKTDVQPTPFYDTMKEYYPQTVNELCAPEMKGKWTGGVYKNPYVKGISDITMKDVKIDPLLLDKAFDSYAQKVFSQIDRADMEELKPLSDLEAINGIVGEPYINSINFSAGGGFGMRGKKSNYLETTEDGLRSWVPSVWKQIDKIRSCAVKEETYLPVMKAHLKNEVRTFKKRSLEEQEVIRKYHVGKTDDEINMLYPQYDNFVTRYPKDARLFTGVPAAFGHEIRKYFLPVANLILKHGMRCEMAVGVDACSGSWKVLYDYLTTFGVERLIAGDFSGYDKMLTTKLLLTAFKVLILIARQSRFFTQAVTLYMWVLALSSVNPIYIVLDVIVQFLASLPSGHPLTTILNSICNSLLLRLAWMSSGFDIDHFNRAVHALVFGDDNVLNVHLAYDFSHTCISNAFADMGIVYTMADKSSESVPFIHIDVVEFLKRGFSPCGDRVYAPLAFQSIIKMLTLKYDVKVPEMSHVIDVTDCALREAYQHGPEFYAHLRDILSVCWRRYGVVYYLPTYEETGVRFDDAYATTQVLPLKMSIMSACLGNFVLVISNIPYVDIVSAVLEEMFFTRFGPHWRLVLAAIEAQNVVALWVHMWMFVFSLIAQFGDYWWYMPLAHIAFNFIGFNMERNGVLQYTISWGRDKLLNIEIANTLAYFMTVLQLCGSNHVIVIVYLIFALWKSHIVVEALTIAQQHRDRPWIKYNIVPSVLLGAYVSAVSNASVCFEVPTWYYVSSATFVVVMFAIGIWRTIVT